MPPSLAHFGLADFVAGTAGALGAAMALFRRERSGEGEEVDVALYEPLMTLVGDIVVDYSALGVIRERRGNSVGVASPVGTFLTKDDKWIVISGSSDKMTHLLFGAMGRDDLAIDPRFATNAVRLQHEEEITGLIQTWVGTLDRGEILELLQKRGVVSGPVNTAEDIVKDLHFQHRTLVTGKSDLIGDVVVPGQMVHLASTPQVVYQDPPLVGEHTAAVLHGLLGMAPSEVTRLRESGVVA
jgi:crotonobetainyl-CoA:carnitine CoA-transferase CaiB-like acyl-CoA transferase